jgi:coenzyme F420 hydrogenase subunit delta
VQLLTEALEARPAWCRARILVLGCGNELFGDDGFGPAVVEWLEAHARGRVPADVLWLDVGTGVRTLLFALALSDERPARLIVVDSVDAGWEPGDVAVLDADALPAGRPAGSSLHGVPTSALLKHLRDASGMQVAVVCAQVDRLPETVSPGLSDRLRHAVPRAGELVLEKVTSDV